MSYDDLLGSSQEHRRLRFSFQINNVKDRRPPQRPHCLAPVSGGGGDVVASEVRVNQLLKEAFQHRRQPLKADFQTPESLAEAAL